MKLGIVIGVIAIIGLIAAGSWWLVSGMEGEETGQHDTTAVQDDDDSDADHEHEDESAEASVIITYTDDGFRLSGNTVHAGDTVLVVNESNEDLDFASDPHPHHTDNHELNADVIEPGEQKAIVVTETGAWGFHNHLNDDHTGSITVID